MSEHASQLALLLVYDIYGDLNGRIYQALLHCGRASIQTLQKNARLPLRQIKHGLSVLAQQHLLFWYTPSPGEPTLYEPNLLAAYNLVRNGKYVQITEDRFGTIAGEIISNLLLLGHARIGDLIKVYREGHAVRPQELGPSKVPHSSGKSQDPPQSSHQNGLKDSVSLQEVHRTVGRLLEFGLISVIHESKFRSEADIEIELEKIIPPVEQYKGKSKKEREVMRERKKHEKRLEWKYGSNSERAEIGDFKKGTKRLLEYSTDLESRKRLKLDMTSSSKNTGKNGLREAGEDISDPLNKDHLVVGANHDKFALLMRNDFLIGIVEKRLGKVTSKIYRCILKMLEYNLRACREPPMPGSSEEEHDAASLPKVSTDIVAAAFPDPTETAAALGLVENGMVDDQELDHPKKRRRKNIATGGDSSNHNSLMDSSTKSHAARRFSSSHRESFDSDEEENDDYNAPTGPIRQHLLLLSTHPDCFLVHIAATPTEAESWGVNYRSLSQTLTCQILFQTIASRYDTISSRIARICHEKGRLDDKTLCTLSLLSQKELRARLLTLQNAGLLEQQEVPRDNARVASRTNFLYYFDERKCAAKILEDSYKTMVRCLQRLDLERGKVAGVLDKTERSDVKGREEEILGEKEKEALAKWREVEAKIYGEVARIDGLVSVLRDF